MGLSGNLFFRVIFSLQIRLKRLRPQIPLLHTTRHLQASCKMIRDQNWGLGGPKCVKTIRKHHKYPPKVSPNTWVAGGGAPATHGTEWERLMYAKGYPTLSGDSRARRPTWARGGVLRVGPQRVTGFFFFFRPLVPAAGRAKCPPVESVGIG